MDTSAYPSATVRQAELIPIAPISLAGMGSIPSVHILPGEIDQNRLSTALEQASVLWPVIKGRFIRQKCEIPEIGWNYYFALTGSPVPFAFETSDSASPPFPSNIVVQPDLAPYITDLSPSKQLNGDEPLLSVKVTYFTKQNITALGIVLAHIVGDGFCAMKFTQCLSKLYQLGSINLLSEDAKAVTLRPHVTIPLNKPSKLYSLHVLEGFKSLPEVGAVYTKAHLESEAVQIDFTMDELKKLRETATPDNGKFISEQDALSSYLANILGICGEPITEIMNSINYRRYHPTHPAFPPNLPSLCATVAQMLSSKIPPYSFQSPSLKAGALAVREGINVLRNNSDECLEWLANASYWMKKACDVQESQIYVPPEGHLYVNSNYQYDWNAAGSFSFPPDTCSFHTSFTGLNFLRVFRSNPGNGDGRGVEAVMRVKKDIYERLLEEIDKDRREGWSRWK